MDRIHIPVPAPAVALSLLSAGAAGNPPLDDADFRRRRPLVARHYIPARVRHDACVLWAMLLNQSLQLLVGLVSGRCLWV